MSMNYKLKETEQQSQEQQIKLTEESSVALDFLCAASLSLSLVPKPRTNGNQA